MISNEIDKSERHKLFLAESGYIEHKGHYLPLHVTSGDHIKYANCRYCGQLIAFQKFQKYVIENEDAVMPYAARHTHIISSWWICWDVDPDTKTVAYHRHSCSNQGRLLK